MNPDRSSSALLLVGIFVLAGCLGYPGVKDRTAREPTGASTSTTVGPESTPLGSESESQSVFSPTPKEGFPTATPTQPVPAIEVTDFPEPILQPSPILAPGQPVTISYIDMIDAENGWAIGGNREPGDRILSTQDGGQTWSDVTPAETAPEPVAYLQKYILGFFPDSERAWVTFHSDHPENNVVWRTVDGGENWSAGRPVPNDSLELYSPRFLHFVDENYGWLLLSGVGLGNEYVSLFATTDGGETWVKRIDPNISGLHGCTKTGILFSDIQQGWLTRDCSGLVVTGGAELDQTDDGGITWAVQQLPPPESEPDLFQRTSCGLHSLNLLTPRSVSFVLKCLSVNDAEQNQQFTYSTMDGGESWSTSPYPGGSLLMLDQIYGWALSRDIYKTTDGGLTWEHLKAVRWDGQFDFVDENNGFAVARSGEEIALVRTDDGGRTWQLLEPTRYN